MWSLVQLQLFTQFLSLILLLLHFHAIASPLLYSNSSSSTPRLCHVDEHTALIHFKNSFSLSSLSYSPNPYPKTKSWKEGTDCCRWNGVTCDVETGYVIGLNLSHSMLYGTFPTNSSLFFISHLQYLDLSFNEFKSSQIPSNFALFSNLRYLTLSNSHFVGQVPSEISLLSKLVSFDLSSKDEQGYPNSNRLSIETAVFNKLFRNLTMLRELDLSYVNMSFFVPSSFMNLSSSLLSLKLSGCGLQQNSLEYIARFSRLVSLDLSFNYYDPSIETIAFSKVLQNLTMLRQLDLTFVNMSLVSPTSFLNLSSFVSSLTLNNCDLSGKFPGAILQRPNLRLLDLGGNGITGFLSPTSNMNGSLRYLYLSFNKISNIDFVSNLNTLEELDLNDSWNFLGSNLSLLGNLTQLNELHLCPNNFKGSEIPYSFGKLVKLTSLDFRSCNFSGQIPFSLGNLNQLSVLDLMHNNLNGPNPSSLGNLTQLSNLYLSNNNLSGHIPSSLGNLRRLSDLRIEKNNLGGFIPISFANLTQLKFLYLSNNQLIGSIPSHLGMLLNLAHLDLSNNLLNRTIPISLFTLPFLHSLKLHNNLITGEIAQFQHNSSLIYIDLSNNKLHGSISRSISNFISLSALILSNNNFKGELSTSICKLKNLQIIDLSNNSLSGRIPKCLGNFSNNLEFLHVGMNYFNGTIPLKFSKGNSLRYVNFYSNEFEGKVPQSLINCKDLEFLDLGKNKIVDTFPLSLGALPNLKVLLLGSNKLHGIVKKFNPKYAFPSLQIFDLSNNNLRGPLPSEYFDHLEAMMVTDSNPYYRYMGEEISGDSYYYSAELTVKGLVITVKIQSILVAVDFSQNRFTGQIPKSIGKLKALIHLNLSHNFLGDFIPQSLGNLNNLNSLDLSWNFLVGRIPIQLLDLTFLGVFNVSYNQLQGPIPNGKQFNTFDNSSYEGNVGLCGFPLTKQCNNGGESQQVNPSKEENSESNESGFGWEAVVVGYGCGVIFGIGIGYIIVFKTRKRSWFVRMVEAEGYLWRMKFDKFRNARRAQGGRRN